MGKKIISAALALLMLMFAVPTTVFAAAVSELPSAETALGQSVSASDESAADIADVIIDADAKKAEIPASANEPENEPADEPENEPADEPVDQPEAPAADGGESLKAAVYNVWVGGKQFDSSQLTISCTSGTATLDPTTTPYTLTLNGASVTGSHAYGATISSVFSDSALKINLVGDNAVSLVTDADRTTYGIFVLTGDLQIVGDGSLNVYAINTGNENTAAIRTQDGSIDFAAKKVTANGLNDGQATTCGVWAAKKNIISAGTVTAAGTSSAFYRVPEYASGVAGRVTVDSEVLGGSKLPWDRTTALNNTKYKYVSIEAGVAINTAALNGWKAPVTGVSTLDLLKEIRAASSTPHFTIKSRRIYNKTTNATADGSTSIFCNAGSEYCYVITLTPDAGYAFADNAGATFDGKTSVIDTAKSGVDGYDYVVYTTLAKPLIAIMNTGFKGYSDPLDGVTCDSLLTSVTAATSDVTIVEKYWYCDDTMFRLKPGERFEAGKKYSLCVCLKAKSGYALDNYTTGTIDGSSTNVDSAGGYIRSEDKFVVWSKPVTAAASVYVNGTALTEKNNTLACGSGTATLNVNTTPATLTLDNANITSAYTFGAEHCGILAHIPLKIMVSGANTIQVSGAQYYQTGIYCTGGELTIDGGGTLDIKANSSSGIAYGIETYKGNITVNGGTLGIEAVGASGKNSFGLCCSNASAYNTAPHINGGAVMISSSNKAVSIKPVVASSMVVWTSSNTNGTGAAAWDKSTALTTYKWLYFERNNKPALTEVGISGFHPPVAGETAGANIASVKPTDPEKYYLKEFTVGVIGTASVYWYNVTDGKALKDTDKFVAGKKYSLCAFIRAGAGYSINGTTKGMVNSETKRLDTVSEYDASLGCYRLWTNDIVVSKVARLAGASRTSTAAAISSTAFTSSKYVIIASGDNYADALAGVSLAGALNAPILLVVKAYGLDAATKAEIKRLGATNAIILGGTGAIPDTVANSLKKDCGCAVERLKGASRYGTAVAIAKYMDDMRGKTAGSVFFVYAANYPDALAVSGVAASKNAPILYMDKPGKLDADTLAYMQKLGARPFIYIIGGTGVISADAEKELKSFDNDGNVKRVYGSDRYQTCLKINQDPEFKTCFTGENLCVATALSFPDALAGGVLCARLKAPLVLVPKTSSGSNEQYFTPQHNYIKSYDPTNVYIFGGEAAVGKDIEDLLAK